MTLGTQSIRDFFRKLALQREKVGDFAIKSVGPHVGVIARVYKLGVHPNAIAGSPDGPLQNMSNTEGGADLP